MAGALSDQDNMALLPAMAPRDRSAPPRPRPPVQRRYYADPHAVSALFRLPLRRQGDREPAVRDRGELSAEPRRKPLEPRQTTDRAADRGDSAPAGHALRRGARDHRSRQSAGGERRSPPGPCRGAPRLLACPYVSRRAGTEWHAVD